VPNYTVQYQSPKPKAFLITDDEFFLTRVYKITPDEMSKVNALASDLFLIGYVDYTDQFDQHHRGGYARKYWPMLDTKGRYETDEEFDQQKFDRRKQSDRQRERGLQP